MIYAKTINLPKLGDSGNPGEEALEVTKGLVYKVEIDFPPGPSGLCQIRIYDGNYQMWPSSPDEFFAAEDYTISFDDIYLKTIPPYEFRIAGYNLDDTYPHKVQVRVGMVSKDVFIARFLPTYAYSEFKKMLTEMEAEEEERTRELLERPFPWLV